MTQVNPRSQYRVDRALFGLAALGAGALAVAVAEFMEVGPLGRKVAWIDAALAVYVASTVGALIALPIALMSLFISTLLREIVKIRLVLALLGGIGAGTVALAIGFAVTKPMFMPMSSPLILFYSMTASLLSAAAFAWGLPEVVLRRISIDQMAALMWLLISATMLAAVGIASQRALDGPSALMPLLGSAIAIGGIALITPKRSVAAAGSAAALWALTGVLLWWSESPLSLKANPQRAEGSVIMIVLDTLRADATDLNGAQGQTPFLSELARSSATFDEFISEAPWTVPSHATMFTGLSPHEHGCWWGDRRWLHDDLETVAERLAAAGYDTTAFVSNGYLEIANTLQGFDTKADLMRPYDGLILNRLMRMTGLGLERWMDKGSVEAVPVLDDWFANRDPDRPYFLFINLLEVHAPYAPPRVDRELPGSAGTRDMIRAYRSFNESKWHVKALSEGLDVDLIRALYAAEVRYQDRSLRRIIETIDKHHAPEDVSLLITSDHGENLGEGGRWGHVFELNEALIRTPLLIRAPGRIEVGERIEGAFSSVDLAPTVLALAGQPTDIGKGTSLLPGSRTPRPVTFAEVYPYYGHIHQMVHDVRVGLARYRYPVRAVREGSFKLVERGPELRLYDIEKDSAETIDIADQHPDVVARLSELLGVVVMERESDRDRPVESDATIDEEEMKARLRALGYL